MDIYKTQGFFTATAKTKTSKAGNEYTSIGVAMASKGLDGTYEKTWLNMIEPKDLLVLSNICKDLYSEIEQAKADERQGGQSKPSQSDWNAPNNDIDDDIVGVPF